jgi:uncharacterized protein (DUF1800 family)
MKRVLLTVAAASLAAVILPLSGDATGPFDKRLSPQQQIIHALNRLTFGARPGDIEEVRRIGLAKWIELQLHPNQIPENPTLEAKLKPLETLRMDLAEVVKEYTPKQQAMMAMMSTAFEPINNLLSNEQRRKVMTGTAEERTEVLKALDADKRRQVLAALPVNVVTYTPEYKQEAEEAQKMRQEEVKKEARRRNPQLADLLNSDQMIAAKSGDKGLVTALLASLDQDKRIEVASLLPPNNLAEIPELRREAQRRRTPRQVASEDLKEGRVFRAIYSNRQLEEVLVDFWFNHFNVDATKNLATFGNTQNLGHLLIGSYERDAIRPHVLGHFKDLLLATARHPAMLYYLDNWESMAPGSFEVGPFAPVRGTVNGIPNSILPLFGRQQAHGINENYGREVMELHTLGVKGGYTQDDVIAVARCFTGWTVRSPENPEFVFAPFMHDFGEKTVLGHKIAAGGGEGDGLQVIDLLAHHPSTAKFISRELARHFVADDPPQALVDRMAQTFTSTDGDLRAVLETMLKSTEFFSEGAWEARIKSPLEMVVSTVRAMGGEVTDAWTLVQKIAEMGEPLYSKLEPTGYPDTGETWLSTAGIMARINFPTALASGQVPGVSPDASRWKGMDASAIARDLLGHDPSAQTLNAIETGLQGKDPAPSFIASLILSSPDFERR